MTTTVTTSDGVNRPEGPQERWVDIIDSGRDWADEHARMAPESLEAARSAGLFLVWAPSEVGGGELTLPELMALFETLGAADPTVGWHVGNSAALSMASAYLDPATRAEIFSGHRGPFGFSVVQGGVAEVTEGGYRLSGRWPNVTGALDAPWVALNAVVHERGEPRSTGRGPDVRLCLMPASDLEVEDTWGAASAMRGTGSHAVRVDDAYLPEARAHSWFNPRIIDRPLYRLPTVVSGPVFTAGLTVGMLRRVLAETTSLAAGKISAATTTPFRDAPWVQAKLGETHAAVEVLSAGLQAMAVAVWADAEAGRVMPANRGRMWSTAYWTMDQCRHLVSGLATVSTSAVYIGRNPIETGLRDIHAVATAHEPLRSLQEAAGRVHLGLRPAMPFF